MRPSQFTEDLATYVLEQMGQGRTLVDICDFPDNTAPAGLPRSGIVRSWTLTEDSKVGGVSFLRLYNVAREAMADSMFESLQAISDKPLPGDRTEVRTEGELVEMVLITDKHVGQVLNIKEADGSVGKLTVSAEMVGMTMPVQVAPATVVKKVQTLDNTERTKIKVDVRKFIASKIKPAAYGDRMAHQMLDENGNPAKAGITVIVDGAPGTV